MTHERTTNLFYLIVGIILLLLAAWLTWWLVYRPEVALKTSSAAVALQASSSAVYSNTVGEPVSLAAELGQVLVVQSFASWCPECHDTLTALSDTANLLAGKPVVVLAVNRAEPASTVVAYLDSLQLSEAVEVVLDDSDYFYQTTDSFAMPETIIYNQDGEIAYRHHGRVDVAVLTAEVESLLGEG